MRRKFLRIVGEEKKTRRLRVVPEGCGTCWGLLHYKDKPYTQPAVLHTKLQEWGHHEWLSLCDNDCSIQWKGNGQGSQLQRCSTECVCLCACVHWEITQECEDTCQRQRICILLALWRNITIPSKSLSRQPHWIELIKVLWSAKDAFSFPADAKGELLGLCDMAWNFNFLSSYTFTGFKKIYL